MNQHVEFALAYPVFDPEKHIIRELWPRGHFWQAARFVMAGLTVNIGME